MEQIGALSVSCRAALDQEGLVLALRDELRRAKPELLEGATLEDAVMASLHKRSTWVGLRAWGIPQNELQNGLQDRLPPTAT